MNSMFDFDGVKLAVHAMRRLPTLGIKASEDFFCRVTPGHERALAIGEKMSTGQARVGPKDLRAEFRGWQTEFTLQLQKITFQLEDMRQQVEGLRDLMAPFDVTFVAAVKASSERAMQLYMVVNDRSSPQLDCLDPMQTEKVEGRCPEIQRQQVE
jgi:hypothetical protein